MSQNNTNIDLKKDKAINIFISVIFVLVLIGVFTLFHLMSTQVKSSEKIVNEVSQQIALNVNNRIAGDVQVLEMIAASIGDNFGKFKPADLNSYLKTGGRSGAFDTFSFIQLNGTAYTTKRSLNNKVIITNESKSNCFAQAKSGEACFSRVLISSDEVEDIYKNVYAVPIKSRGRIVAILSAEPRADIFKSILDVNTFNSTAFSHIVNAQGEYILRSDNKAIDIFQNFFDQPETFITIRKSTLMRNFKMLVSGTFWVHLAGQIWICSYTPVSFGDWLIILYVPAKILALSVIEVIFFTIGIMLAINCLLFLIMKRIEKMQNEAYDKMMKVAFYDDVTGGYNKAKFIIEAQNILKNVSPQDKYALILMDIAKFKVINELYGFDMANVILKDIYGIIKANMPEKYLLARSYAATYIFIIKYANDNDINNIIDKIHHDISNYNNDKMKKLKTMNNKVVAKLVPLFGVYLINDITVPIYMMCDRVGLAKRTISDDVNKYISYYDDNLRRKLLNEKNIEDEMHAALASHQFVMYLQPKYDMKSLKIAGGEALVRWVHPTKGFIPPGEFIPLFEKNGFVLNVDRYMWEQACKAIKSWIERGYNPVPISVNVSRLHLSNEFFIDDLKELVAKYDIPTKLLELELTETASFEDFDKFKDIVSELKAQGFSIAMDDFGSGYSSLNMLRQIPCDILKLDRGFINDTTTSERGKIVVQSVLSMAKNLSLKTVSEGIETVEQAQFLTDSGCDIAQGFLYAKPMPLEEFERLAFTEAAKLNIDGLKINS
ncbi:GGDEF domain-containing protein [bacterium]|nr:GGDEF domain-containing protein [bacterium]